MPPQEEEKPPAPVDKIPWKIGANQPIPDELSEALHRVIWPLTGLGINGTWNTIPQIHNIFFRLFKMDGANFSLSHKSPRDFSRSQGYLSWPSCHYLFIFDVRQEFLVSCKMVARGKLYRCFQAITWSYHLKFNNRSSS